MLSSKNHRYGLVACAIALLMLGCGTPSSYQKSANLSGGRSNATFAVSDTVVGAESNMENLNSSGELDMLTDDELAYLGGEAETVQTSSDLTTFAAGGKPKSLTRIGFIRSNTPGKFFLQVKKGILWWKRENSIPLGSTSEGTTLKIADALNKKVILRGPGQDETVMVARIHRLLDFGAIWDLLSKGRISGKVYDNYTKVGVSQAAVTLKSFTTGRIWRTKSDTLGDFAIGRLEPGEYEIAAKGPDYNAGAKDKIVVRKRQTTDVYLNLLAEVSVPVVLEATNNYY
ncbi:MAG: carboxypeptidase regulatory-like domain-containing protein [Cyanobacteria bacterium NC_groundwater_1444_Ag_S-0.65um_54_12]|nr:carboxypeptidase regulatory-like domain-containing protein [Cyanobacteria bacterium NC_groundwater_1444_Ag_S-0.65um_54_12]